MATRSVYKGQTIGELPLPTKDGFVFAGWWTAGGELVTAEMIVTGALWGPHSKNEGAAMQTIDKAKAHCRYVGVGILAFPI